MARLRVSASSLVVDVALGRSRGRVRAWRSSRERVADASSRHLAVSPPRLLAVAAFTHAPLNFELISTLYSLSSRSALFSSCTPYWYSVLIYLVAFTSRGRAILRISVALLSCSSRGRAFCYRVAVLCLLSDSSRIYVTLRLFQLCVAQPSRLIN